MGRTSITLTRFYDGWPDYLPPNILALVFGST